MGLDISDRIKEMLADPVARRRELKEDNAPTFIREMATFKGQIFGGFYYDPENKLWKPIKHTQNGDLLILQETRYDHIQKDGPYIQIVFNVSDSKYQSKNIEPYEDSLNLRNDVVYQFLESRSGSASGVFLGRARDRTHLPDINRINITYLVK